MSLKKKKIAVFMTKNKKFIEQNIQKETKTKEETRSGSVLGGSRCIILSFQCESVAMV